MAWKVRLSSSVLKALKKFDPNEAKRIAKFLKKLEKLDDPRRLGKPLKGPLGEFWRYRVGIIVLFVV